MEEKELKTSLKTRIFIAVIAVIMVGSIIAGYIAIVLSGNNSDKSAEVDTQKLAEYQQEYTQAQTELESDSQADFEVFVPYRAEVVAYDQTAANEAGLQTRDLLEGEGKELTEGDTDYLVFYVGWCPDASVFDTTLNDATDPTGFNNILDVPAAGDGLIEGWRSGVVGMKIGGIRELTIPGDQAYKDQEICGGTNMPLKFIVMAVANEDPLKSLAEQMSLLIVKMQYAQYGLDYDEIAQ